MDDENETSSSQGHETEDANIQEYSKQIKHSPSSTTGSCTRQRRSTRSTRWKGSKEAPHPKTSTRGKSRRSIFKKTPFKSPEAIVIPTTSNFVFFKGVYLQVGDVVSVMDEMGSLYYAQLRGFLTDQYCEKSACITWLIPTSESPEDGSFDPNTFILGPEEDVPRKLEFMEFVQHAPLDHFNRLAVNKYCTPDLDINRKGYIWTSPRSLSLSQ